MVATLCSVVLFAGCSPSENTEGDDVATLCGVELKHECRDCPGSDATFSKFTIAVIGDGVVNEFKTEDGETQMREAIIESNVTTQRSKTLAQPSHDYGKTKKEKKESQRNCG